MVFPIKLNANKEKEKREKRGGEGKKRKREMNERETVAKPFPIPFNTKKRVENWSLHDVGEWLQSVGFYQYRDDFVFNEIDGKKLLALSQNDVTGFCLFSFFSFSSLSLFSVSFLSFPSFPLFYSLSLFSTFSFFSLLSLSLPFLLKISQTSKTKKTTINWLSTELMQREPHREKMVNFLGRLREGVSGSLAGSLSDSSSTSTLAPESPRGISGVFLILFFVIFF